MNLTLAGGAGGGKRTFGHEAGEGWKDRQHAEHSLSLDDLFLQLSLWWVVRCVRQTTMAFSLWGVCANLCQTPRSVERPAPALDVAHAAPDECNHQPSMMMAWHEDLGERVVPGQEGRANEEAGEVVLAQAQGLEDLGKDGLLARRRQRQVDAVQRLFVNKG